MPPQERHKFPLFIYEKDEAQPEICLPLAQLNATCQIGGPVKIPLKK